MTQPGSRLSDNRIADLEQRAAATAQQEDLSKFSTAGLDVLAESVTTYVHELVAESKRRANREALDGVSATHVEKARDALIARSATKIYQLLGNCGAVLLGVVIPNVFLIVDSAKPSSFLVVGTILCGIVGSALIMVQWART